MHGITNNEEDNSIDSFNSTTCKLIQKLVIGDEIKCAIKKRGVLPNGKGTVTFRCPIVIFLNCFDWIDEESFIVNYTFYGKKKQFFYA